ncbi:hypothetical protein TNCT_36641 [Trichonephila clavata]|uniref:Uncharacterized protein n=1 Tax=Trichonephila clavata TaxID=2740835 RepID=A0A8X6LIE3_TRICU|nr:hypothetical protein TNCT_36641 [Trichonephila clavata]
MAFQRTSASPGHGFFAVPDRWWGSLRVGEVLEVLKDFFRNPIFPKADINYNQLQDIPDSFGNLRVHPRLYWDQLINLEVPPPSISVTEGGGKPVGNRLTPPSNPLIACESFSSPSRHPEMRYPTRKSSD